jgi:hypothetical protein
VAASEDALLGLLKKKIVTHHTRQRLERKNKPWKQQLQKEETDMGTGDMQEAISAGMGPFMQIGSAFMRKPAVPVDVGKCEQDAEDRMALGIGPRIGVDNNAKPAMTIEDILAKGSPSVAEEVNLKKVAKSLADKDRTPGRAGIVRRAILHGIAQGGVPVHLYKSKDKVDREAALKARADVLDLGGMSSKQLAKHLGESYVSDYMELMDLYGGRNVSRAGNEVITFKKPGDAKTFAQEMAIAYPSIKRAMKIKGNVVTISSHAIQKADEPAWRAYYSEDADSLEEKWGVKTVVNPKERGKYDGWTEDELRKEYNELKASGPHKAGSKELGTMKELAFAIRAKTGWGKVESVHQKDEDLPSVSVLREGKYASMGFSISRIRPDMKKRAKELLAKQADNPGEPKGYVAILKAVAGGYLDSAQSVLDDPSSEEGANKALFRLYKKPKMSPAQMGKMSPRQYAGRSEDVEVASASILRESKGYPYRIGEKKKQIGGWTAKLEPGLFIYGGFGVGTYYSTDGNAYSMGSREAQKRAKKEGVKYVNRDSFEGYRPIYLGDDEIPSATILREADDEMDDEEGEEELPPVEVGVKDAPKSHKDLEKKLKGKARNLAGLIAHVRQAVGGARSEDMDVEEEDTFDEAIGRRKKMLAGKYGQQKVDPYYTKAQVDRYSRGGERGEHDTIGDWLYHFDGMDFRDGWAQAAKQMLAKGETMGLNKDMLKLIASSNWKNQDKIIDILEKGGVKARKLAKALTHCSKHQDNPLVRTEGIRKLARRGELETWDEPDDPGIQKRMTGPESKKATTPKAKWKAAQSEKRQKRVDTPEGHKARREAHEKKRGEKMCGFIPCSKMPKKESTDDGDLGDRAVAEAEQWLAKSLGMDLPQAVEPVASATHERSGPFSVDEAIAMAESLIQQTQEAEGIQSAGVATAAFGPIKSGSGGMRFNVGKGGEKDEKTDEKGEPKKAAKKGERKCWPAKKGCKSPNVRVFDNCCEPE